MDPTPDRIVRRDFPRASDGYDPAAVDAHLEAIAALVGGDPSGVRAGRTAAPGGSPADQDLLAAGRVLLGQITALRVELRNASAALRDQSLAISETLDQLLDLDDAPGPADAESPDPARPGSPRPAAEEAGLVPPPADPGPPPAPDPAAAPATPSPAVPAPAQETAASTLADARLVALDMAFGGSDRDEIGSELGRRFDLPDPFALADEVLAAIG